MKIAIVNLMPNKEETENQWIQALANAPKSVEIDWIRTHHESKNTSLEYLEKKYILFSDIKDRFYDAMVITGAPVEKLPFEEVDYWEEFKGILDFARTNVFSTMFVCWAAPAALFHYYGIPKFITEEKISGIYENEIDTDSPLMHEVGNLFWGPQSRYFYTKEEDINAVSALKIIAKCAASGIHIIASNDYREIYVNGHNEYDDDSIDKEYRRDIAKGIPIKMPENYYIDNDMNKGIMAQWRDHSHLLYRNWLQLVALSCS
ncbi:MAG: homoserine O-succinyltransferase [Bacteroidetes bacterium]|nr:homoserine O-succinyltransferase [Bacteroidota bacterium]MCL2303089.1 homoserine O-succinyltransferase [Lentimicrobiaceae bacterium]